MTNVRVCLLTNHNDDASFYNIRSSGFSGLVWSLDWEMMSADLSTYLNVNILQRTSVPVSATNDLSLLLD